MEIGNPFTNLTSYNQNMAKGLEDKLFFIERIPLDQEYVFVDFGCADGTLINTLYHIYNRSENKYVGFDISETMIDLAKTKINDSPRNVFFTSDWNDVIREVENTDKKKVLILSSVIHEVFSYGTADDIKTFWKRVLDTGFDYICVRDMMVPKSTSIERTPKDWLSCFKWDLGIVPRSRTKEFIEKWGPLEIKENALHYLLKYRWQINWSREINENYFPISIETFLDVFKIDYNLDYFIRFRIPFLDKCIKDDFDIVFSPTDSTHIKAIFSKKTY